MRGKPDERDEGARRILDLAKSGGLTIDVLPSGEVLVSHVRLGKAIVYSNQKDLGSFLVAILLDGGGRWRLDPS